MESVRATREEVKCFLSVEKYYCGYGGIPIYGYGDGSGYGYGYKDGSGSSTVYKYKNGSGSIYGYDDGSGYGDGYGYGDNSGSGSISGFGSDDIKALNGNIVDYIDNVPTIITQVHNNIACGYIIKEDLTLESCFIAKAGNSFAHGKTLKEAVADAKAKELGKMTVEERIAKFLEAFGPLDSEHSGKEFYDWHHILTGSCHMGRDEFCRSHSIDLTQKYSVRYFLNITKGSYGSDVIKMIIKAYENTKE